MKITSVFIHIPRTAGTAIKWALNDRIGDLEYIRAQDHRTAVERRKQLGDLWDDLYKFTIVRNPWDRAVSWYHRKGVTTPFKEWLLNSDIGQAGYFIENGQVLVNDVFRFEALDRDLTEICRRAGWPPLNLRTVNDTQHEHYKVYYDDQAIEHVASQCVFEIDAFGYKF